MLRSPGLANWGPLKRCEVRLRRASPWAASLSLRRIGDEDDERRSQDRGRDCEAAEFAERVKLPGWLALSNALGERN